MKRAIFFTALLIACALLMASKAYSANSADNPLRVSNYDGSIVVICETACSEKFIRRTISEYDNLLSQVKHVLKDEFGKNSPNKFNVFGIKLHVVDKEVFDSVIGKYALDSSYIYIVIPSSSEILLRAFNGKKDRDQQQAAYFNACTDLMYQKFAKKIPNMATLRSLLDRADTRARTLVNANALR